VYNGQTKDKEKGYLFSLKNSFAKFIRFIVCGDYAILTFEFWPQNTTKHKNYQDLSIILFWLIIIPNI